MARQSFKERYHQRKSAGMCVHCGKFPPEENKNRCTKCRTAAHDYYVSNRATPATKTPDLSAIQNAKERGERLYDSVVPCPQGHVGKRLLKNYACYTCSRAGQDRRTQYIRKFEPERVLCKSALRRSREQELPFNITPEYVKSIWPVDNLCPILRIELRPGQRGTGPKFDSPSIDRIRPELGYVVGNVAVISMKANLIKQDETDPEVFRSIANWLEKR